QAGQCDDAALAGGQARRPAQRRRRRPGRATHDLTCISRLSRPTAITASVRLVTWSALKIAVMWFFTVCSAADSAREIALLLLPSTRGGSTWICLWVSRRGGGRRARRSPAETEPPARLTFWVARGSAPSSACTGM